MADVFISYKRSDRESVAVIADALARIGFTVWFDANLSAGESFSEEIDREVRSAAAVLVCWSRGARESKWVRSEAMIGFDRGCLAACYIDDPQSFTLPAPFNDNHTDDLRRWLSAPTQVNASWLSVVRRIGRLAGRTDVVQWCEFNTRTPVSALRSWLATYPNSPLHAQVQAVVLERVRQQSMPPVIEVPATRIDTQTKLQPMGPVAIVASVMVAVVFFIGWIALTQNARDAQIRANATPSEAERRLEREAFTAPFQTSSPTDTPLRAGETLGGLLLRSGVTQDDVAEVRRVLRPVYDEARLQQGQRIQLYFSQGVFRGLALKSEPGASVFVNRGADGSFNAREVEHPLIFEIARVSGRAGGNLYASMIARGATDREAGALVDALGGLDITGADHFEIVFERYYDDDGNTVRTGDTLFVEVELPQGVLTLYSFMAPGSVRPEWYDRYGRGRREGVRVLSGRARGLFDIERARIDTLRAVRQEEAER